MLYGGQVPRVNPETKFDTEAPAGVFSSQVGCLHEVACTSPAASLHVLVNNAPPGLPPSHPLNRDYVFQAAFPKLATKRRPWPTCSSELKAA
jgi:hypothetical protein